MEHEPGRTRVDTIAAVPRGVEGVVRHELPDLHDLAERLAAVARTHGRYAERLM